MPVKLFDTDSANFPYQSFYQIMLFQEVFNLFMFNTEVKYR